MEKVLLKQMNFDAPQCINNSGTGSIPSTHTLYVQYAVRSIYHTKKCFVIMKEKNYLMKENIFFTVEAHDDGTGTEQPQESALKQHIQFLNACIQSEYIKDMVINFIFLLRNPFSFHITMAFCFVSPGLKTAI